MLPVMKFGEGNGTPLQYSSLENPMDRGTWWAAVHGLHRVGHDLSDLVAAADGTGCRDLSFLNTEL